MFLIKLQTRLQSILRFHGDGIAHRPRCRIPHANHLVRCWIPRLLGWFPAATYIGGQQLPVATEFYGIDLAIGFQFRAHAPVRRSVELQSPIEDDSERTIGSNCDTFESIVAKARRLAQRIRVIQGDFVLDVVEQASACGQKLSVFAERDSIDVRLQHGANKVSFPAPPTD